MLIFLVGCGPTDAPSDAPAAPDTHTATPERPATKVVNVIPVVDGQPANGYRESGSTRGGVNSCDEPSQSAVSPDIYSCDVASDFADACYPSTATVLLCVQTPWRQDLSRTTLTAPRTLPSVTPIAEPVPFAIELDNGDRCQLRNREFVGQFKRADGNAPVWSCSLASGGSGSGLAKDDEPVIDRSAPLWTIQVGMLGGGEHPEPPTTRTVTTAWFAAAAGTE